MEKTAYRKSRLAELIQRFSVSFRLRPAYASRTGEGPEIGCEVELIGEHYSMGKHLGPGCPYCLEVLLVLLELHDRTLSGQGSLYPVDQIGAQCEKWIRYASAAGDWPEVALDVKVMRRPDLPQGPESWAIKLTDHIRTELVELGCREIPVAYIPVELMADRRPFLAERAM